jgi:hypothetical protein
MLNGAVGVLLKALIRLYNLLFVGETIEQL